MDNNKIAKEILLQGFLSRYYESSLESFKEEDSFEDVVNYRANLEAALEEIKALPLDSMVAIQKMMDVLKSNFIEKFQTSNNYYCEYDTEHNTYRGVFPVGSGFFKLFNAKEALLTLDRKGVDKDSFIELLRFFGHISDRVYKVTDQMLEDLTNQRFYFKDLQPVSMEESFFPFQEQRIKEFTEQQGTIVTNLISVQEKGIKFELGRKFQNNYGNILQAVKVILSGQRGDSELIVYVPCSVLGVYTLGKNKFVSNHTVEDYIANSSINPMKAILRSIVKTSLAFTKSYKISEENKEILRKGLQTALNGLMFAKRIIKATNAQIKMKAEMEDLSRAQAEALLKDKEYYFSPFTTIEGMTPFELKVQHHKLYFREYVTTSTTSGANILKNIGSNGYERFRGFPLNNGLLTYFDPAYMNNKADFAVAYMTKNHSMVEMIPLGMHNHQSFRDAGSSFIIGHAFETKAPAEKPLTISDTLINEIPSYNMLFAMMDFVDSNGSSTNEGCRQIHTHYADKLGLWEAIKIAFQGYDKGISRIMTDDVYCIVNGTKYPLNVTSMVNMPSRQNFGVMLEALYNAKKFFNGNTETEFRDFYTNPLKMEELMDFVEVFVNGESLGKHPVGMFQSFFVKDIDSSYKIQEDDQEDEQEEEQDDKDVTPEFKSYKLGIEWFMRARLMGAHGLVKYLLGDSESIAKAIKELEERNDRNLYGKNGAVTALFQKSVLGFIATATPNVLLRPDQVSIKLTDAEFELFIENIKRLAKDIDVEKVREDFNSGKSISLPPSLIVGNPSIDDANTIYEEVTVSKGSKYTLFGYVEVNPTLWLRMGRDFDGDIATLLFFAYGLRKELKQFFSYTLRNITEYGFEYAARDILLGVPEDIYDASQLHLLPSKYPYTNLDEYVRWVSLIKKYKPGKPLNEKFADDTVKLFHKTLTKREVIVGTSSNLMTTRVSKQLIGVSKTVTMRGMGLLEIILETVNAPQELKDRLRLYCDRMNWTLVQPTIDIQKWSDNLREVIKTILLVYRVSEAVSYKLESYLYPTRRTYNTLRNMGLKSGLISKKT
ncbi:MAG: hypothetical protein EOM67_11280, partial [Spirochaetia bacterium]|nr:hypothetical protein [Spirochaetia bacterium]